MKAVIYARYSSDNQREESIEGQLRECKAFAGKNDIQIIGTYIDRALSAKTDNRPEFQRMIKESAGRAFEMVLVWKLDRFARNRYDSAHYKAVLRKNGVRVVSATEAISEGAEGILLEAMLKGFPKTFTSCRQRKPPSSAASEKRKRFEGWRHSRTNAARLQSRRGRKSRSRSAQQTRRRVVTPSGKPHLKQNTSPSSNVSTSSAPKWKLSIPAPSLPPVSQSVPKRSKPLLPKSARPSPASCRFLHTAKQQRQLIVI